MNHFVLKLVGLSIVTVAACQNQSANTRSEASEFFCRMTPRATNGIPECFTDRKRCEHDKTILCKRQEAAWCYEAVALDGKAYTPCFSTPEDCDEMRTTHIFRDNDKARCSRLDPKDFVY